MECVVVLGLPRGGTSAVGCVIHYLGIPMLVPGRITQNLEARRQFSDLRPRYPLGDMEDGFAYNVSWPATDAPGDVSNDPTQEDYDALLFRNRYRSTLDEEDIQRLQRWVNHRGRSANAGRFGVKDHRFVMLMRPFVNELRTLGHSVRVVQVTRPLAECVDSLVRSTVLPMKEGGDPLLWAQARQFYLAWRISQALEALEELQVPVLTVQFNELLDKPRELVAQIAQFLGVPATVEAVQAVKSHAERYPSREET